MLSVLLFKLCCVYTVRTSELHCEAQEHIYEGDDGAELEKSVICAWPGVLFCPEPLCVGQRSRYEGYCVPPPAAHLIKE